MPYKLTYFDGPGRGELARLVFAAGATEFEDVRIPMADWGAKKADPEHIVHKGFGQMPILEGDEGLVVPQSAAIANYLGDVLLDAGSLTPLQRARSNALIAFHADQQKAMYGALFGSDEAKEKGKADFLAGVEKQLKYLENNLPESGFTGGSKVTVGDLAIFDLATSPFPGYGAFKVDTSAFPRFTALIAAVGELPGIKAYTAKRGF